MVSECLCVSGIMKSLYVFVCMISLFVFHFKFILFSIEYILFFGGLDKFNFVWLCFLCVFIYGVSIEREFFLVMFWVCG